MNNGNTMEVLDSSCISAIFMCVWNSDKALQEHTLRVLPPNRVNPAGHMSTAAILDGKNSHSSSLLFGRGGHRWLGGLLQWKKHLWKAGFTLSQGSLHIRSPVRLEEKFKSHWQSVMEHFAIEHCSMGTVFLNRTEDKLNKRFKD